MRSPNRGAYRIYWKY